MYTEVMQVIKAVIFDMYETLITLFDSPLYFGTQMRVLQKKDSKKHGVQKKKIERQEKSL